MKSSTLSIGTGMILALSGLIWTISLYRAIKPETERGGPAMEVNFSLQDEMRTTSFTPSGGTTYILYLLLTNNAVKPGVPEIGPDSPRTFAGTISISVTSAGGDTLSGREYPEPDYPYLEPASFALYTLDTLMIAEADGDITVTAHILRADPAFSTVTAEITLRPPLKDRDPGSLLALYGQLVFAMFLTLLGLSTIIISAIVYRVSSKSHQPVL